MNAAQKADSVETVSKIAAVVNLFRCQFPNALADLNPWIESAETARYEDQDSIDLSFHVVRHSWMCQCRSVLMQIHLHPTVLTQASRTVDKVSAEIQLSGHDCTGQQWYFSTRRGQRFTGMILPLPEAQDRLRYIAFRGLKLFHRTQAKQDMRQD
jgi:hypothetical protein